MEVVVLVVEKMKLPRAFSFLQRSNEGRKNAFFGSVHGFVTLFSRAPPR